MSSLITTIAVSVATTLATLRGIDIPNDPPTDTPPAARVLMASAKAGLRDLAAALLRSQPAQTAAELQTAMADALTPTGAFTHCEAANGNYGNLDPPKVTSPAEDFIAVIVTIQIPCGSDDALFLFHRERGVWTLVLDRERNDYEEIAGAAGDLQLRVSPPDAHGSRLVLTADINPWCSSAWQSLRWEVNRLNPRWRMPEEVASGSEIVYVTDDITLDAGPDTFALDYTGSSICPAHVAREYHRHYRVLPGNRLERIEPIATYPLEYVEEWLLMNPRFAMDRDGEFGEISRCRDGLWQLRHDPYDEDGETVYFLVAEENGKFRMLSTGRDPHDGCEATP